MIDLTTKYLGMNLRSPLVASASPLSEDIDNIKRMEDAGAAAVVLYSLFEEQLSLQNSNVHSQLAVHTDSFPEAQSFFPSLSEFHAGPEEYLEHIYKAKEAVGIPVIASLNGTSAGIWTDYSRYMEEAGADAIELNIYYMPADIDMTGAEVEQAYVDIVLSVKDAVQIPVAVKIGPYFSNVAHMAWRLDAAGANALVLFNRFYQPDINLTTLEVRPRLLLSTPQSLRLPLRWIAMLHGRLRANLAATGGVHSGEDAIKLIMAGADVTMMCSALLRHGIRYIKRAEEEMLEWMERYEYESVSEMKGSMSQRNASDPSAYERAQYIRTLQSY